MASNLLLRIRRGGRGVVKGTPVAQAGSPTALPGQLEIVEDESPQRNVIEADHKLENTDDYLTQINKGWGTAVKDLTNPDNRKAYLHARGQIDQVDLVSMGYDDTMPMLSHTYSSDLLIPAIDAINGAVTLIRRVVPVALQGLDLKTMMGQRDWLDFLRGVRKKGELFLRGVDVLIVHTEQMLHASADQVNRRTDQLAQEHFELGQALRPLHNLFSGGAEAAAVTRNDYAKVEEKTLEKVKEEMAAKQGNQSPSEPPPGGTPATGTPPAEPPAPPAPPAPSSKGHPRTKSRK